MKKKSIYLANPYGFSKSHKDLLKPIIEKLESLGLEVLEPFSRNNQIDFADQDWAYKVGQRDVNDVCACDAIFAVINGEAPDVGVAYELGLAHAWGKKIFLFRDDFRKCNDSESYSVNLMLFSGLPKQSWSQHYITDVNDITANNALTQWAKEQPIFGAAAMYADYPTDDRDPWL